jgi:hypothetical protein
MLNKSNFLIAKLAAGDDDGAMPLHTGIWVEPEYTAVTDGRLAVRVSAYEADQNALLFDLDGLEPAEHWTGFLLDKDSALKVAAAIPAKSELAQAGFGLVDATTEDNPKAMVAVNSVRRQSIVRSEKVGVKFPDLERLTPSKESARFMIRVNPELLLDLLKTVAQFCKSHRIDCIELRAYSGKKPLRIDAVSDLQEMLALLMPMGEAEFGAPEADEAANVLTAKLWDIKKLADDDRRALRSFVMGGDKVTVRYRDTPMVREILARLEKRDEAEKSNEDEEGEV